MKKVKTFKNDEKERQKVLDNFYTKKIKNGKSARADFFDKMFLGISMSLVIIFLLYKLIGNFIVSVLLGIIIMVVMIKYLKEISKKNRLIKIEEIKKEYKIKLEEEKIISEDEDIEDYIIKRYYEKKKELKSNMNFLGIDKIFKLYFLSLVFFVSSYFVSYPKYYKLIAIFTFIAATSIGSYNLIEYMKKKDQEDLLNEDLDV